MTGLQRANLRGRFEWAERGLGGGDVRRVMRWMSLAEECDGQNL